MRIPGDEAFSSYHISTILGDNEHDMKYALSALRRSAGLHCWSQCSAADRAQRLGQRGSTESRQLPSAPQLGAIGLNWAARPILDKRKGLVCGREPGPGCK
jgi:hypothetical protein